MKSISIEGLTVLRAVSRDPWRTLDGAEVMEKIFASTIEIPMDSTQICRSVAELESLGLLVVDRGGIIDTEYDFATIRISDEGIKYLRPI